MFTKLRNIVQSKTNALKTNNDSAPVSNSSNRLSELSSFDECIEACDAQASSPNSNINTTDCSVLVSPDGDLLFVPTNVKSSNNKNNDEDAAAHQKELFKEEEYESAVRVGMLFVVCIDNLMLSIFIINVASTNIYLI